MTTTKVEVLTGPQGGGKSTVMRDEAISNGGQYLFALPTIELIEEQAAEFIRQKPSLRLAKVHKDSGPGSVGKRLTAQRKKFAADKISDGVIFTTHETLMSHDLQGFGGWHVRIDEAPAAIQAGRFNIGVMMRPWLKENFDLISVPGNEWSALSMRTERPNWKAIQQASGAKEAAEFIKQAAVPERVFVRTASWDENDQLDWFSMWTPLALRQFASVTIAGSSYTDSVGYKAARYLFDDLLEFSEREVSKPRREQPSIFISYFTKSHESSTQFWKSSEGRLCIKKVCDHLSTSLKAGAYWSGNEVVQHLMEHRLPGTLIKPMAMGINKHRPSRQCAFIFSAKATPSDKGLKTVFSLTNDDIRAAREDDAIVQFIMRGAIRDLDYGEDYSIWLYSQSQAQMLHARLLQIGFSTVTMEGVDAAGIMDTVRPAKERTDATTEEREERKKQRALKAKDRSQKNRNKKRKPAEAAEDGLK